MCLFLVLVNITQHEIRGTKYYTYWDPSSLVEVAFLGSQVSLVKTKTPVLGNSIDLLIIVYKMGADKVTSTAPFKGVIFYSLSRFL